LARPPATLTADAIIDSARQLYSGAAPAMHVERRDRKRVPFTARIPMVLVTRDGQKLGPLFVRGRDLSVCGMSVTSRNMIHAGQRGVIQLRRSGGQVALIGIEVMHCRYIGAMQHQTGLRFTHDLPMELSPLEFLRRNGSMVLLDRNLPEQPDELEALP
jgi:hypothetical protein